MEHIFALKYLLAIPVKVKATDFLTSVALGPVFEKVAPRHRPVAANSDTPYWYVVREFTPTNERASS
jgi:hypothetical protein